MPKKKKKKRKSKVKKLQALSLREVADAVCKIKSANLHECVIEHKDDRL